MKLLIFTTQFYSLGGYERLAVELAEGLNHLGIHTDLMSQYTDTVPGVSDTESRIKASGVQEIYYLGLNVHPNLFSLFRSIIRFRRFIIDNQYDAVEVSGFTPTLIASIASLGIRLKVFNGIHTSYHKDLYGGLKYFFWRQILKINRNSTFYGISQSVAESWSKYMNFGPDRTQVVYNSINECYFKVNKKCQLDQMFSQLGILKKNRILLFVGRLHESKGVDIILDAVKPLLEQKELHLIYVGREETTESNKGETPLDRLKFEIKNAAWGERVHFLGQRSDVHEIMAYCDILVHPARIEGFGLVLAEALAVGLPVIASNIGGIPEVLENTDSLLIPAGNSSALRQAIDSVLNWSQKTRSKAILKGKQRAEDFRSKKRAENILDLIISKTKTR
jgi:glycosyltransferase involved in cell wall biosynthesis